MVVNTSTIKTKSKEEIESPCVSVCRQGDHGYCIGCFRSGKEARQWRRLDNEQKRDILKMIIQRKIDHAL
ncbi:MAG: DUF1289 domain-containing protein [Pseudomonadales bacterium]|nr:DUF1289 domain-containing protein [Pseudomonadales bacterium]